jgi:hypothetical protein
MRSATGARARRQPRCLAARWTRVASERAGDRIPQRSGSCTRAAPASGRHGRSRWSHAFCALFWSDGLSTRAVIPDPDRPQRPRSCAREHRQPGRGRWQSRRSRLAGLIEAEAAAYELTRGGGGTRPGGHHGRGDNTRAAESPAWRGKQSRRPAQPTATLSEQRTAGRNHEAQSSWSPDAGPVCAVDRALFA